jgi:putative ABC transport system ATP-binding protein
VKTTPPLMEIRALSKFYNYGEPGEVKAVTLVNLDIHRGEVVVLAGPSGSGKTTLLSLIGCMSRPSSGSVRVEGKLVSKLPERFLTEVRRQTFGFIFQQLNLISELSALENIVLPLYPLFHSFNEMLAISHNLLEEFDLTKMKDRAVAKLSGGEQQRVAIARALVNNPQIIIADEPTAHLDLALSKEVLKMLERLKSAGRTIIFATHDPLVYEHPFVDRVIEMCDGKVKEDG